MGAVVDLADGAGIRAKGEALGYCLDHRDVVVEQWRTQLDAAGEIKWVTEGDDVRDLRPAGVPAFLAEADGVLQQALPQGDAVNQGACPHCAGEVLWGAGPHVEDARQRAGSTAWVCDSCGAAGLAYMKR